MKKLMPKPPTKPSSKIQPLGDRVLIAAPPAEKPGAETVVGGIVIPAMASGVTRNNVDSPHMVSTVLACGAECKLVEKGDRIVVRKPDCFVVKVGEVEHVMVREQHIVALV